MCMYFDDGVLDRTVKLREQCPQRGVTRIENLLSVPAGEISDY